ncbi:PAS domain-containing protein [Pedobacter gandavensis]|uniref:PAS domain-containing sensor histidine kinase n=1 Tax=Pedobacter gandavensis TaxID=2679963 RepID=UPI0029315E0B|nr:PAS domain-containing protein [Pedobacter gandavensis]
MISTSLENHSSVPANDLAANILNLIDVACLQLDKNHNLIYGNHKAAVLFKLELSEIMARNVWEVFDKNLCKEAFDAIEYAVRKQKSHISEYFCALTEIWVSLHVIPSGNGVVLMFTEITEISMVKLQLLEEQRRLKLAQEIGNIGYFEGITDAAPLYLSDEIYRIYGFLAQEKPLNFEDLFSYFHPADRFQAMDSFRKHLKTRRSFEQSYRLITALKEAKMVHMKVEFLYEAKTGTTRFYGVMQDVTAYHQTTQELKESKELIESVFDASLLGISLLRAVRDASGEIINFRIEMLSRELQRESRREDLIGKLYLSEFPGVRNSGLLEVMLRVMQTGETEQTEFYYNLDGFNEWYSSMFVKMEDALVVTTVNISTRKFAEQELSKNLMILQQSEDMAKIGSWEYDLDSASFNWSDGMYHLFDLSKDQIPSPEIYLQYATPKYSAVAEKIVGLLKAGNEGFEESIEIMVNQQAKVLKIKASIQQDENGKPLKVLGVDIDMTLQVELFRKNELLQKEIFRTILGTQQEERKRIAENLHNGLGQLLYGVKLSLAKNMINHTSLSSLDHLKELKQTDSLLSDAIKESRRLSHELMPTVLEDFGLKAALDDICNQFQIAIPIHTVYTGLEKKLDKFLETAIYRVVQELMMNVLKHAKASKIKLVINANDEVIHIQIMDDGVGFEQEQVINKGIGLKAIRNKANLLNGCLAINSVLGQGTVVSVLFPNVPS